MADVEIVPTPNEIKHEAAIRRIDITCNVKDRDLGSVARDVEEKVQGGPVRPRVPPGVPRRIRGPAGIDATALLAVGSGPRRDRGAALHRTSARWRLTAGRLLTLPFALIGGVAAVLLTDGVLSLGSLVGFVTVLGIAARNGIMLVSHYRHLEDEEGVPFGDELVLRGAEERLSPILMTALATGLALLPLAIAGNKPGHEIEYPLAVVILGGLVTSTVLNLFLLPCHVPAVWRGRKSSSRIPLRFRQ